MIREATILLDWLAIMIEMWLFSWFSIISSFANVLLVKNTLLHQVFSMNLDSFFHVMMRYGFEAIWWNAVIFMILQLKSPIDIRIFSISTITCFFRIYEMWSKPWSWHNLTSISESEKLLSSLQPILLDTKWYQN